MARLIVVTHQYDRFATRSLKWPVLRSHYLLFGILREFERLGHSWRVAVGPKPIAGDVALLHTDCTIVDPAYLALRSQYPRTINFGADDISKHKVSKIRLLRDDEWAGPVIVKANLNAQGSMEARHNVRASIAGRAAPHAATKPPEPYRVLDRLADVDARVWTDPNLIVERFLPEPDADGGYALRSWIFMGSHERCNRYVSPDRIVKAAQFRSHAPVEVPIELRAERERLGFDYGKFDFVVHDGKPILLDANRTPSTALTIMALIKAGARNLADGLDKLVRGAT